MDAHRDNDQRRTRAHGTWLTIGLLCLAALLLAAACGPFGDDDSDNTTANDDAGSPTSTATTRDVVISTFTPTVPGQTPASQITRAAFETAQVMTATEQALNPQASASPALDANGTPFPDPLQPPMATLIHNGDQIEGNLGSYAWQFNDQPESFPIVQSVFIDLGQISLSVPSGDPLTLKYHGKEYRTPPQTLTVRAFNYDENSAVPIDQNGNVMGSGEPVFAVKTDPLLDVQPDPAAPEFNLDVPPGHYGIQVQANWGPNPLFPKPQDIFVFWVFNVTVI